MSEANSGLGAASSAMAARDPPETRRSPWLRRRWGVSLFLCVVALPLLLYSLYLGVFAAHRYVSEFRVLVRSPGQTQQFGLTQLAGLSVSSQSNDNAYAIIQYLESQEAATELDARYHLRKIYADPRIDPFSRVSSRASDAALTRYWNGKLDAYYENTTDTIVVKVTAFDAGTALMLSKGTLQLSEELVNGMSRRSRSDLLAYAARDVDEARRKLEAINASLYALRNRQDLIDPRQSATAELARRSKIQDEITATQVEIDARRPYQSPGSVVMQALAKRLNALRAGLASVDAEAVARDSPTDRTLSASISAFEKVQADQEFAQKEYQSALSALQAARDENLRQQIYLDTVVKPTRPDERSFPNYPRQFSILLLFALSLWGLLVAAVRYSRDRM